MKKTILIVEDEIDVAKEYALILEENGHKKFRYAQIENAIYKNLITDFDTIEIQDYLNRQKLVLDQKTFLAYQAKKIKEQELLDRFLTESQSIQEAFKLFGFNMPPESSTGKDSQPISSATP